MSSEYDLISLRARVVELESRLDFLYRKLGFEYVDNPGMADSQIIALLRKGNKIEAIKAYRELTNTSLAEAKSAVEDIESRMQ